MNDEQLHTDSNDVYSGDDPKSQDGMILITGAKFKLIWDFTVNVTVFVASTRFTIRKLTETYGNSWKAEIWPVNPSRIDYRILLEST